MIPFSRNHQHNAFAIFFLLSKTVPISSEEIRKCAFITLRLNLHIKSNEPK